MRRLLLILLISTSARAENSASCANRRLDDPDKAFAKIPIYDQKKNEPRDPDMCYSIVAAELRDAARFNQGDKLDTLSAPLSVAINGKVGILRATFEQTAHYGFDTGQNLREGSTTAAIAFNNDQPVCDQKHLENYFSQAYDKTSDGLDKFLNEMYDQISDAFKAQPAGSFPLRPYFDCKIHSGVTNLNQILAATRAAFDKVPNLLPSGQKFLAELCRDHSFKSSVGEPVFYNARPDFDEADRLFAIRDSKKSTPKQKAAAQKAVNKLLDKNAQRQRLRNKMDEILNQSSPTGISYCLEVLQGQKNCSPSHISAVIGRQWRNGHCEYLVRDSYGPQCPYKFDCDRGSVWVPGDVLLSTADGLTFIPPK